MKLKQDNQHGMSTCQNENNNTLPLKVTGWMKQKRRKCGRPKTLGKKLLETRAMDQ